MATATEPDHVEYLPDSGHYFGLAADEWDVTHGKTTTVTEYRRFPPVDHEPVI